MSNGAWTPRPPLTPTSLPAPGPAGLRFAGLRAGLPGPGGLRRSQQQRVSLGAGHGAEPPRAGAASSSTGEVHPRGTGGARAAGLRTLARRSLTLRFPAPLSSAPAAQPGWWRHPSSGPAP